MDNSITISLDGGSSSFKAKGIDVNFSTDVANLQYEQATTNAQNAANTAINSVMMYDCSAKGTVTFDTLTLAIAAVPLAYQKGGLHIKYVDTSSNKYVVYFLTTPTWSTVISDWQSSNELIKFAKNGTGATILKGKAIYINGNTGANPIFQIATNTDYTIASRTWGITLDNINNNAVGRIIHFGTVDGLDTSAYTAGTELWLGTNGDFTNVRPTSPAFQTSIGMVIRQHATVGSIFVNMRYVNIEGVRSQNPNTSPSSKLLDDESNKNECYNVTNRIPLDAGQYYDLTSAIAAVPVVNRKLGLKLTYMSALYEKDTLTVTAAPTSASNIMITLNGVVVTIALDSATDTTPELVATKIKAATFTGWTLSGTGAVVIFTKNVVGVCSAPIFDAGTTGATASFIRTVVGTAESIIETQFNGSSIASWTAQANWRRVANNDDLVQLGANLNQIQIGNSYNSFILNNWVTGGYNFQTGELTTITDRYRLKISAYSEGYIASAIQSGYNKLYRIALYGENDVYLGETSFSGGYFYKLPKNRLIRYVIVIALKDEFTNNCSIISTYDVNSLEALKDKIDSTNQSIVDMKSSIEALSPINGFSSYYINAADYGFRPTNSAEQNSLVLNNLLQGGNKIVDITLPGTYLLSSSIILDDNTIIRSHQGVVIKKNNVFGEVFINKNALDKTTNRNYNIELYGLNIDTNGYSSPRSNKLGLRSVLGFYKVDNLTIKNIKITNDQMQFFIQVCDFNNFILDNFILDTKIGTHTSDGVHFGNGDKFSVTNGIICSTDDCIALNASDWVDSNPSYGDITNGYIANIVDVDRESVGGYFMRSLTGKWVDWYSGMKLVNGDFVCSDGKLYRISGNYTGNIPSEYTSTTQPTGILDIITPEGYTYIYIGNAIYSANVSNILIEKCTLNKNRKTLQILGATEYPYSRTIRPEIESSDYPITSIVYRNCTFNQKINDAVEIPANYKFKLIFDSCSINIYNRFINSGQTDYGFIILSKCDITGMDNINRQLIQIGSGVYVNIDSLIKNFTPKVVNSSGARIVSNSVIEIESGISSLSGNNGDMIATTDGVYICKNGAYTLL